jgi:hypothetical protein
MTFSRPNDISERVRNAEQTLRLIANAPPPEGLVDRVQAGLRAAPRRSILASWRSSLSPNGWMYSPALRGAAAAAIVCLVAGGGWRIYSRVQPAPTAKVIVMPAREGNSSGFSNAGAMRTPDTLQGPVLTHAIVPAGQSTVAPATARKPQLLAPKPNRATKKKKAASALPR